MGLQFLKIAVIDLVLGSILGLGMGIAQNFALTPVHAHVLLLGWASLGIAGGIWSQKFDHIAAVTNFVVTPLAFLSGTFYTVDRLPEPWHMLALWNPFFYMIDGFRYGFLGHHDGDLGLGIAMMTLVNAALLWLCHWMFRSGYRLRP